MDTNIIVPKVRKTYYLNSQEKKTQQDSVRDFEAKVREWMSQNVHPEWEKFLTTKYTEERFGISYNHYPVNNFYMVSYGKPFNPTEKHIEMMKTFISNSIEKRENEISQNNKYEFLRELVVPILTEEIKNPIRPYLQDYDIIIYFNSNDFTVEIRVMEKKEENDQLWMIRDYIMKCTISQNGEISKPKSQSYSITTVESAREYIKKYSNLDELLSCYADYLKGILPKEYFNS